MPCATSWVPGQFQAIKSSQGHKNGAQARGVSVSAVQVRLVPKDELLVIILPIIAGEPPPESGQSRSHVAGQDLQSGAVYLSGRPLPERLAAGGLIDITAVLFTQGINEVQTVANLQGRTSLQEQINNESLRVLKSYVSAANVFMDRYYSRWCSRSEWEAERRRRGDLLSETEGRIVRSRRIKDVMILSSTSNLSRKVGGGRCTCCKSAKDRTAMSVTLEETLMLSEYHRLPTTSRLPLTQVLRTHGVRRENVRKNIGKAQYAFNSIQNYMLPIEYQCPPGTGGGRIS